MLDASVPPLLPSSPFTRTCSVRAASARRVRISVRSGRRCPGLVADSILLVVLYLCHVISMGNLHHPPVLSFPPAVRRLRDMTTNGRGTDGVDARVRHVVKNGGPVHSGTVPVLPRGRPTRAWVDVSRHLQLTNDDLVSGTAYPIAEKRESDTWNGAVQGHEHVRLGGSQTGSRTNGDGRFPASNAPANGRILLSVSWQPRFMPRCGTEAG
eukprot:scaffold461_cov321-Pavlova_lutheri.AAC.12